MDEKEKLAKWVKETADDIDKYIVARIKRNYWRYDTARLHFFVVETPCGEDLILLVSGSKLPPKCKSLVSIMVCPVCLDECEANQYPLYEWKRAADAFLALAEDNGCVVS